MSETQLYREAEIRSLEATNSVGEIMKKYKSLQNSTEVRKPECVPLSPHIIEWPSLFCLKDIQIR